jgi:hypothetical protein
VNRDLEAVLRGFDDTEFPVDLCTIQNTREPEVFDSDPRVSYLCVLMDKRWPDRLELLTLRPYTAKDPETKEILYGWTDGDAVFDHYERSIHRDDRRVVAWRKFSNPVFGPENWPD